MRVADGRDVQQPICERQNVLAAFAQRRDTQRDDVEAVIEILAKVMRGDFGLEIAIGRGDYSRIDVDRAFAADALEVLILQKAQKLGLEGGRQVGNLVEKNGAAVGRLETARLVLDRAGERAADVAEKFAFEKFLRERSAIDDNERLALARAPSMNLPRDDVFAGTAFAGEQDSGVACGGLARGFEQALHRGTLRVEQRFLVDGAAQCAIFGGQQSDVQRAIDGVLNLLERERLGDVVVGAGLHRLDGIFDGRVSGHQNYEGFGRPALDL